MSYTLQDLGLIQNVVNYIERVRKSFRKEEEMVKLTEINPAGLPKLSKNGAYAEFYKMLWHSRVSANRVCETPVVTEQNNEESATKNMVQYYNAERAMRCCIFSYCHPVRPNLHNCSMMNLDSETLPELARLDGEMTTQIADYFINIIQSEIPSHIFIHMGNTNSKQKHLYERFFC